MMTVSSKSCSNVRHVRFDESDDTESLVLKKSRL